MKRLFAALLLFLAIASPAALAQGPAACNNVKITGTLYSQTPTGKLVSQPFSIKSLLGYFKHSDVNPRQVAMFMDGPAIFLASRNGATTYGYVLYLNTQGVAVSKEHNPIITYNSTFLNSDLAGKSLSQQKMKGKKLQMKFKMVGDGSNNGLNIILKGNLSFTLDVG